MEEGRGEGMEEGICMAYSMHGICMEYVWNMHGICMGYAWNMYGICMHGIFRGRRLSGGFPHGTNLTMSAANDTGIHL